MNDETPQEDDAGLAALRQVADRATVQSIKQTVLACMLIRAVGQSRAPRRRRTVIALALSAGLAISHYWHVLVILLHLSH